MPVWFILFITALYMAGLFVMAWRQDAKVRAGNDRQSPLIYALALCVYCTSWTYYGAVGTAASSGWEYLPIYIGPALIFMLLPGMIRRIGDIAQREGINSLSGFLSARYGKSKALGAVAAIAAVTGALPYIALQLKSVGMSFAALTSGSGMQASEPQGETVLLTAVALAVFAILFGARHSDASQHNSGMMRVLAFEAVFKLVALIAIFLLSIVVLGQDAPAPNVSFDSVFQSSDIGARFVTITLLSMGAIICLPRQFHVAMIERRDAKEVRTARWLLPLYLLVTSMVVVPITLAGLSALPEGTQPDLFVLALPLAQGEGMLAMLVFLGGFSAATGMVIVATVALSNMVTSDLIVPSMMGRGRLERFGHDAAARLTSIRRIVIAGLLFLAYLYYQVTNDDALLAQIGLISFAAAIQFAPALLGGIYWRGGRQAGALLGLSAGMALWLYTMVLPAMIGVGNIAAYVPEWLNPHALFGANLSDSLTHGVVWSLAVNTALYVIVSLRSRERLRDRVQAAAFVNRSGAPFAQGTGEAIQVGRATPDGLHALATRFLTSSAVDSVFETLGKETGCAVRGSEPADWRLVQGTERLLTGALGASSARVVLSSALGGQDVALPDLLSILDQKTQAERFDRHMLQSMLEHVAPGISVVDQDQRLVAWNSAYVALFDYPPDLVRVGQPVAELIRHNLQQGWISGDPAIEAERRIGHMRAGRQHTYERENPDGRFLRITGNPMPGGGYVTTFTDVTQDHERQQALMRANETLEQRVLLRTTELQKLTEDLDAARLDAEGANASKTRFLAAASHDLLQPLNAARLFLGAMQSGIQTAEGRLDEHKLQELVAKTDRSIQSADELLKGLLDISRLDHGAVEVKPERLLLGPLLEDLADEAEPMTVRAGLTLRLAPTRLAVMADPEFLKSILRNFISNARRYTRNGGLLIGARPRSNKVIVEVWDTGPGIPSDRHSQIFDEFKRFEDADNLGIRGAGLGLSVASRLARLMGAELSLASVVGRGSVFRVILPRAGVATRIAEKLAPNLLQPNIPLKGMRVCCIDDEATILEGMQQLLESWGCEVVCVSEPAALREAVLTGGHHAIIADLQLGHSAKETGLDLIAALSGHLPHHQNAALLTARASGEASDAARASGYTVLHKPASPDDIRRFLETCRQRAVHQAAE